MINVHGARGSGGALASSFHFAAPALTTHRTEDAATPLHVPPRAQCVAPAVPDIPIQNLHREVSPPSARIDSLFKITTIMPPEAQNQHPGFGAEGGEGGGGSGGDGGRSAVCVDERYSIDTTVLGDLPSGNSEVAVLSALWDVRGNHLGGSQQLDALRGSLDVLPGDSAATYDSSFSFKARGTDETGEGLFTPEPTSTAVERNDALLGAAGGCGDAVTITMLAKLVDDMKRFNAFTDNINTDCATLLLLHENHLGGLLATATCLTGGYF